MSGFLWNALNEAEAYRAAAAEKARRGSGSTVTVYASSKTMDAARGGSSEGFQAAYCARKSWEIAKDRILDDLRVSLFGDDLADFVPF